MTFHRLQYKIEMASQQFKRRNNKRTGRKHNDGAGLSMATVLLPGRADPPTTPNYAIFQRSLMIGANAGSVASNVATLSAAQIATAEASAGGQPATRFSGLRIKQIEVWGQAQAIGSSAENITLRLSGATSDGAEFVDYGVYGSKRPHICVRPNLNYRENWLATSDTGTLFQISGSGLSTTTAPDYVVRLVVELR